MSKSIGIFGFAGSILSTTINVVEGSTKALGASINPLLEAGAVHAMSLKEKAIHSHAETLTELWESEEQREKAYALVQETASRKLF